MEIKKSEVIASIVIVAFMFVVGFIIEGQIRQGLLEKYQEYETAIQTDNKEQFEYGMKTNIGNALIYGELKTIDPVSFPELHEKYSLVRKEEQEYRNHPKKVEKKYKDSNGEEYTKIEIEDDWTWDTMRTETKKATKVSFLNIEFEYDKIPLPMCHQVSIIKTGYNKRNVYYATERNFEGTIFTVLKNNTINETSFYEGKTIKETIQSVESGIEIIIFWILWILLTVILVVVFYYLENNWLD